jgi:hypothetical protein
MNDKEWEPVVEKLIEQTISGKVQWWPESKLDEVRENVVGDGYCAEVMGRRIAAYEFRYKRYSDEDLWEWDEDVAVEFVDADCKLLWRWPGVSNRYRLVDAIRYQHANAKQFANEFLKAM